ncbi:RNA polymerase factor sigma-54 [Pseudotabrizicola alkalilacus]|uniref:RNA polymerase sigma-54 factor n=1 Tax=Pseudotabrizicola alkalilacus TaxID=2305252 RepID=A0A411YZZ0_9RHOB|nr:RNA polymerase sigma-54 factor [Pseudotabrizicola alkalilacus]RGP36366.1 RNA polymerase sigma-54 factor [Pseudotabrizicola alkalilacus]
MIGIDLGLKQRTSLAITPVLREAIGFMVMSNAELSARLADLAQTGAVLKVVVGAEAYNWFSLLRQISPPTSGRHCQPPDVHFGPGGFDAERLPQSDAGLIAHVESQLSLLVRDREDRRIAQSFLLALEPSGWLSASLAEIAADAGCSVARAELVLRQLQAAEPTGLFARSLAECLTLQAEEQGCLTPAFAALLRNLPLLAAGETEALAAACACGDDMVLDMTRTLRRMNPKPGAAFAEASVVGRPCDLILRRDDDGWLLELNAQTVPALRLESGTDTPIHALREARALIQAVERRNATVLTIATEIITRQDAFLRGHAPLAPLTINDLASATGLHRSTVSRATAALTLSLPNRTLGLRSLLCASAPAARQQEGPLSVQAVLDLMRALVAKEDAANPLTDEALAKLLLPEGAALARRTVVKYRKLAGIPARAVRRDA